MGSLPMRRWRSPSQVLCLLTPPTTPSKVAPRSRLASGDSKTTQTPADGLQRARRHETVGVNGKGFPASRLTGRADWTRPRADLGPLRPARHMQRTERGDQRPPRGPPRLRAGGLQPPNCFAGCLLETGGFRPLLHPGLWRARLVTGNAAGRIRVRGRWMRLGKRSRPPPGSGGTPRGYIVAGSPSPAVGARGGASRPSSTIVAAQRGAHAGPRYLTSGVWSRVPQPLSGFASRVC